MDKPLVISAKKLGWLAMPVFCERCFWICQRLTVAPPFSKFPKIFTEIDLLTKRLVHAHFDRHMKFPAWLEPLGTLTRYVPTPTHHTFKMMFGNDNVLLRGSPDDIFTLSTGELVIVDYKTAPARGNEDPLLPMYKVQANVYAMLAAHTRIGVTKKLALIYTPPLTGPDVVGQDASILDDGFVMNFGATIFEIALDIDYVQELVSKARQIFDRPAPPEPCEGCKGCRQLDKLISVATGVPDPWVMI